VPLLVARTNEVAKYMHASVRKLMDRLFANDLKRVTARAEEHVRRRLDERPVLAVEMLLDQCDLELELRPRATVLLELLGKVLRVHPGALRPDDRFSRLLCVDGDELGPEAAEVLARYSPQNAIGVFGYDVLHILETQSDPLLWSKRWSALPGSPKGEDEWIDAILEMTVADFLRFAAAMLPDERQPA
jgi:hypothetical protein